MPISMLFCIIYFISIICLGSLNIGPFSPRVYMTILMFGVLIMNINKTLKRMPNKYIVMFVMFIMMMGLSLSMNGEIEHLGYLKLILSFHFVAIVSYYALGFYVTTEERLVQVTNVLLSILLITSIATILQYYNNPIGWGIRVLFTPSGLSEELQESLANNMNDNLLGRSLAVGIFDYAFSNAMFISSTGVVAMGMTLKQAFPPKSRIFYLIVAICAIIACFMTQQRAAFYLMVLSYIMVLLTYTRHKVVVGIGLGILLFMVLAVGEGAVGIYSDDIGRMSLSTLNMEDDTRHGLWGSAVDFISSHLMWGGPLAYQQLNHGLQSHNFFLNAFIYGGLLGAIFVILMFLMMCLRCFICILKGLSKKRLSCCFAIGVLIFFVCGFFHNASLVLGSTQIFILFPLMLVGETIECSRVIK